MSDDIAERNFTISDSSRRLVDELTGLHRVDAVINNGSREQRKDERKKERHKDKDADNADDAAFSDIIRDELYLSKQACRTKSEITNDPLIEEVTDQESNKSNGRIIGTG